MASTRQRSREGARHRTRAVDRRPAARAVPGAAQRVPGPLEQPRSPSTRRRPATGRSRRRTTSTPSAATGRPTRPSAAGVTAVSERLPARADAGDVHRHGPAQARPHQGAVPGGLHAEADRRPRGRDPRDRGRRAGPARGPGDLRPRHRRRAAGRLARDRQLHGHPARGRRDVGEPHELDARRRRPGPEPGRHPGRARQATSPRSSSAAGR